MTKIISTFTHVGVKTSTQRKIALLAKAQDTNIYDLVEFWAQADWDLAVKSGLVTNAMLSGAKSSRFAKRDITSPSVLKKAQKPAVSRSGASKRGL